MRQSAKTFFPPYQRVKRSPILLLAVFLCFINSHSRADIYRFVTIDGVETFTDAPINKDAKVVIKERKAPAAKSAAKAKTEKVHNVSLDEIVEKTVHASLQPKESSKQYFEPRLPPVGGIITSGVGMRTDPIDGKWRHHNGIDIAIPVGTPVLPAAPGIVVYSGLRSGYGYTVLVEHDNGLVSLYGHNSRLLVVNGQQVDADTTIALSGNTGRSTGPHLHFEAWQAGTNVTPSFMPGSSQKLPKVQLASVKAKSYFRKEVLADGTLLFTNIPPSTP